MYNFIQGKNMGETHNRDFPTLNKRNRMYYTLRHFNITVGDLTKSLIKHKLRNTHENFIL